jgi:Xaa-Pro aminopeptidase
MDYIARLSKIERHLETSGLDAFLVTHLANVRYLCGFSGSSGVLAFAYGKWVFFTDGRYTTQARIEVKGATVVVGRAAPLIVATGWLAESIERSRTLVRIGIESEHTTVAMKSRMEAELHRLIPKPKLRLIPTSEVVEQFRIRKGAEEVRLIRAAVELASGIFPKLQRAIREGVTENEVAGRLDHLARSAGAEKMSFETIVAAGPRSALPHARPSRNKIGKGFVVLDYGVILGGYCSDMTRTVCVGRPSKAARNLYSAVLDAQLAGISAVRAGVQAQEVDAAARNVLKGHKLDRYFTHSLGHGVGIEIHEAPRLAKGQTQTLEAGMVVTIEPGVYIPDRGGVRIEDMVLVTANGCEVLTPTPKELVTC